MQATLAARTRPGIQSRATVVAVVRSSAIVVVIVRSGTLLVAVAVGHLGGGGVRSGSLVVEVLDRARWDCSLFHCRCGGTRQAGGQMMLEKTRHAMATTAHRDRTLKRTVVLSWNPYAKRAGLGDGVVLAARNETGHQLHIDAISRDARHTSRRLGHYRQRQASALLLGHDVPAVPADIRGDAVTTLHARKNRLYLDDRPFLPKDLD